MQIPNVKIEGVSAPKDVRKAVRYPYFDKDASALVATNGHILAVVPVVSDPEDVSGWIPAEAFKAVRKQSVHCAREIKANGNISVPQSGQTFARPVMPDGAQFPDWQRIAKGVDMDRKPDIALSAELLLKLAQAISEDPKHGVSLTFARLEDGGIDPCAPVLVRATGGAYGVLMPMRL